MRLESPRHPQHKNTERESPQACPLYVSEKVIGGLIHTIEVRRELPDLIVARSVSRCSVFRALCSREELEYLSSHGMVVQIGALLGSGLEEVCCVIFVR